MVEVPPQELECPAESPRNGHRATRLAATIALGVDQPQVCQIAGAAGGVPDDVVERRRKLNANRFALRESRTTRGAR